MEITQRYTTQDNRRYLIRLSYNERIADTDQAAAFIHRLEVLDADTQERIETPEKIVRFSIYENFQSFGGYVAVNYLGVRQTAIEQLRTKVLTRVEDYLERLAPAHA